MSLSKRVSNKQAQMRLLTNNQRFNKKLQNKLMVLWKWTKRINRIQLSHFMKNHKIFWWRPILCKKIFQKSNSSQYKFKIHKIWLKLKKSIWWHWSFLKHSEFSNNKKKEHLKKRTILEEGFSKNHKNC